MSIIGVIGVLALLGLVLWAVVAFIPMHPAVRKALVIVVVVSLILWALSLTGIFRHIADVKVPTF